MSGACPRLIDSAAHTVDVTWGISDPLFLTVYATIAGVGMIAAALWRWYATSGGDRDHEPSAVELGYLIDGPLQACYSSIAGLWRVNAVEAAPFSTLRSRGEPPAGASRLTRALHQALRTPQSWTGVVMDGSVQQALAHLKRRLIRRGWLIDERRARRVRWVAAPLFGIGGVGVVRFAVVVGRSGMHGRPGAEVGLAVAAATTLLVAARLLQRPWISTRARQELRWARLKRRHLSPRANHSWVTASPKDLMYAAALYGRPVLLACDSRLARTITINLQERASEPVDVELAVVERLARVRRRRRVRLWGPVPGAGNVDWMVGARPGRFWRLMWRLQSAWRAW